MRYWWVNQNQTFRHEVEGGYLWSPKRKSNGTRNAFYESRREVAPGDLVFSFADTRFGAFGIVRFNVVDTQMSTTFDSVGRQGARRTPTWSGGDSPDGAPHSR